MRRGLAAVLLCVLVLTAGCSAISGPSGNDDDGTPTAAPADVPGVQDGGLENESALLDAHVETITATGYAQEIRTNFTDVNEGETVEVSRQQRTGVAAEGTAYQYQAVTNGVVSSRFVAWGNGTVEYQRIETEGREPSYRTVDPSPAGQLAGRAVLEPRLSSKFEVVDVEQREDAPAVVTLEADELPADSELFPEEVDNVRQYEAQLIVDTEGRILSYAEAAVYDIEGERAEYDFAFRITSLEAPGIERPEWIREAEDE